ncbi:hypothetical protein Q8F55_006762 [Vanrija albida]|uniref:Uncharacterized protein n=1 Tax=Vanrija albida TaxID=181172 RepID=A0ABR3PY17_9TREE
MLILPLLPLLAATSALAQPSASGTATSPAPWRTPGPHAVPGTRLTFPAEGDYWVANGRRGRVGVGRGVQQRGGTQWIDLAHVDTAREAQRMMLIAAWNVRFGPDVPPAYGGAHTSLGRPSLNPFPGRTLSPPPRGGYYLVWEDTGVDGPNVTVAVSDVFEIRKVGTQPRLPEGWERGFGPEQAAETGGAASSVAATSAAAGGGAATTGGGATSSAEPRAAPLLAVVLAAAALALS